MRGNIKRVLCLLLACLLLVNTSSVALAKDKDIDKKTKNDLVKNYEKLMDYAETKDIPIELSLDTFLNEYKQSGYTNVTDYINSYYEILAISNTTSNITSNKTSINLPGISIGIDLERNSEKWYNNTGATLPQEADYSRYNLLNTVKKGDIIFEANRGYGITAHVAIVEGIFYSEEFHQNYIRVVESIVGPGVVRSVLDDERVDDFDVTLLRVNGVSSAQINSAEKFCESQIGKSYKLDFKRDTSKDEKDWYCSELVWAGYYLQGIDLETTGLPNEPGITPRDILRSSEVTEIPFR